MLRIDPNEPTLPIEKAEFREPIDRKEFSDHSDHFDVTDITFAQWAR
jgi:hypothetical protein